MVVNHPTLAFIQIPQKTKEIPPSCLQMPSPIRAFNVALRIEKQKNL